MTPPQRPSRPTRLHETHIQAQQPCRHGPPPPSPASPRPFPSGAGSGPSPPGPRPCHARRCEPTPRRGRQEPGHGRRAREATRPAPGLPAGRRMRAAASTSARRMSPGPDLPLVAQASSAARARWPVRASDARSHGGIHDRALRTRPLGAGPADRARSHCARRRCRCDAPVPVRDVAPACAAGRRPPPRRQACPAPPARPAGETPSEPRAPLAPSKPQAIHRVPSGYSLRIRGTAAVTCALSAGPALYSRATCTLSSTTTTSARTAVQNADQSYGAIRRQDSPGVSSLASRQAPHQVGVGSPVSRRVMRPVTSCPGHRTGVRMHLSCFGDSRRCWS